jgi:hypothetical protein
MQLRKRKRFQRHQIYNVDRAVCGQVAGAIAKKYGDTGFAGHPLAGPDEVRRPGKVTFQFIVFTFTLFCKE